MKSFLKVLAVLLLVFSCNENKKETENFDPIIEKESTSKKKDKAKKPEKMLSEAEFNSFFPKEIESYNLIGVSVSERDGIGTGTYIKGKDYGNIMHYYVTDGYRKGSAAIRNFEDGYQSDQKTWSDGSERISKERDGYKTVALLREKYNTYKISTLYNSRFELTVEGHEKPDDLWTYLKQADLQILDSY